MFSSTGAEGLENLGKLNFKQMVRPAYEIVDFYHAVEHAGEVLAALIGKSIPITKTGNTSGPNDFSRTRCES